MNGLILYLLFAMVVISMLCFIDKENELLHLDETWRRKNIFGKLQIVLLVILLIPAILTCGLLYFIIIFAENVTDKTIELIKAFGTWFIKLGDKK